MAPIDDRQGEYPFPITEDGRNGRFSRLLVGRIGGHTRKDHSQVEMASDAEPQSSADRVARDRQESAELSSNIRHPVHLPMLIRTTKRPAPNNTPLN